ncbi:MAG: chorismate mutase [Terriglobales bacterium]
MKEIADWRRAIDRLDRQMVKLLSRRARCAQALSELKQRQGRPVAEPRREAAVLTNTARANPGPLSPAALRRIYRQIIAECRELQRHRPKSGN